MAGPHAEGFGEGRDFPAAGLAAVQRGLFGGGGREREAAGRAQRAAAGHPPGGLAGRAPASVRGPRWARGCSLAPEGALEAWGAARERASAGRPGPAGAGAPGPPPAGPPPQHQAARGRFAGPARPPPPWGAPLAGPRWCPPSGPRLGRALGRPSGRGSGGLPGGSGRLGVARAGRSAGPTTRSRAGASGVPQRASGAPERRGARRAREDPPPVHGVPRGHPGGEPLSSCPCAAAPTASRTGGRALPVGLLLEPGPGLERGWEAALRAPRGTRGGSQSRSWRCWATRRATFRNP